MNDFQNTIQKIVLIGAGNVATHLGIALTEAGFDITQVYSRTPKSALQLANLLKTECVSTLCDLDTEADLYIISIADHAVEELVSQLHLREKILIHTSGSLPKEVLKTVTSHYGVVYIPQTFIKTISINYQQLVFCIEVSNPLLYTCLETVFKKISNQVLQVTELQRSTLHLASVFASNFTNCLYWIADDLLQKEGLSLPLLYPLIEETAKKPLYGNPRLLQTGPAVRGDENIIKKQAQMLDKEYRGLYEIFTEILKNKL